MKGKYHFVFVLIAFLSACGDDSPDPIVEDLTIEEGILRLVNEHRDDLGLRSLELNEAASRESLTHSENMASGEVEFGHDGFDYRSEVLFEETGANSVGENVAWGQRDAEEVMNDWLNSEGHRDNIEGDFTHIGIGIAPSPDSVLFYTQIFLRI